MPSSERSSRRRKRRACSSCYQRSSDSSKEITAATVTVLEKGKSMGQMHPAKYVYRHHEEEPTTEVEIRRMAKEDLYLVLNGYDSEAMIANLKVVINPLVNWIWIGFLFLAIGTVIAYQLVKKMAPWMFPEDTSPRRFTPARR